MHASSCIASLRLSLKITAIADFPGPKELPRVARSLGKATGRITGWLYKARSQAADVAEQAELTKLQHELQATMQQLHAIQTQLKGGLNPLAPSPMVQRMILSSTGQHGASSGEETDPHVHDDKGTVQRTAVQHRLEVMKVEHSFASSAISQANNAEMDDEIKNNTRQKISRSNTPKLPEADHATTETQTSVQPANEKLPPQGAEVSILPISAEAAGLVQKRDPENTTASELIADALQEENVGQHAMRFFESGRNSPSQTPGKS